MSTLEPVDVQTSTEDPLATQTIQQTSQVGGTGGGAVSYISGRFITSLTFYTGNTDGNFLNGIVVLFNDGTSVTLGTASGTTIGPLDLSSDTLATLWILTTNNSKVFGGNSIGVGGVYVETLRGVKLSTLGSTTPFTSTGWTLVGSAGTASSPQKNMVLVGLGGRDGHAIDALYFYFKSDELMNRGLANVKYSGLKQTPSTAVSVASATVSNQTGTPQQMSITFQEAVASTYTFSTTAGVTLGATTKIKAGLPFVVNGEVDVSAEMSFEVTLGVSKTFSKTFSYTAVVSAPANQSITANANAASYEISGSYTATAAEVWAHAGAISQTVAGEISGVTAYDVTVTYTS